MTAKTIYTIFLIFFTYFLCLTAYYLALSIIGLIEGRKRIRQHEREDYASFLASSFTLRVSIIIPAHNEEDWIADCVKSVLNLNYPEYEIIIVDDGSTDKTMEVLDSLLKLQSADRSFIEHFHCGRIREIFKSKVYPFVTVVSKHGGYKKAGAVNTGLNFAKSRYICTMDADTILEPDALLKVMPHIEKDPDSIIGAGSYFGLVNSFKIRDGKIIKRKFTGESLIAYQNLEYIRSFIGNREAWSRLNIMPLVAGGFGIWRRDILLELGGYSTDFSCEDIEFTFRARDYIVKQGKKNYKILSLPYYVGWTEGPSSIASLISQRCRWQRVVNETVWHYRHMIFNPRYGMLAFITLPYFLFYESLGVFFEITSIGFVAWGYFAGILDVRTFLAFFALMLLTGAANSLASLFSFNRDQKLLGVKDISYFVFLSFLEFFWYRWIISIAKIFGTLTFFRGVKTYEQYTRAKRI